jgi:hypothetical protein
MEQERAETKLYLGQTLPIQCHHDRWLQFCTTRLPYARARGRSEFREVFFGSDVGVKLRWRMLRWACVGYNLCNEEFLVGKIYVLSPGSSPTTIGGGVGGVRAPYITEHSPSCCLPILLREMRSRCRGPPFFPERFRSSRRSRALGKSWALIWSV